jgi:hypothetical protein
MQPTPPRERIAYMEREVARYREDVEAWKTAHDALSDCWVWEDVIAKANFLFDQIMRLDLRIQRVVLVERRSEELDLQDDLRRVLSGWMNHSVQVIPHLDRLQHEYGHVEGLDALRENLSQAKSILAPDDEFFDPDALGPLRDEAINAHRSGLTEPLVEQ